MRNYFNIPIQIFVARLWKLLKSAPFVMVTLVGNFLILLFSAGFYYIEYSANPLVESYLDACWWAFATVTTVGYGDIVPVTPHGKMLGMVLMIGGTGLFATYTALFANALVGRDILKLDRDVRAMTKKVVSAHYVMKTEEESVSRTIQLLREKLDQLEEQVKNRGDDRHSD